MADDDTAAVTHRMSRPDGLDRRVGRWQVRTILAARAVPQCLGSHEYLVQWEEGDRSWEPASLLQLRPGELPLADSVRQSLMREMREMPTICGSYPRVLPRVCCATVHMCERFRSVARGVLVRM